jgi:hypothetical protein
LSLRPKQGLAKVRAKSETPRNVKESEGTNPHTPKWALILGVGISMDSQFFKKKFHWIEKNNITIENILKLTCFKWACMTYLSI